MLLEFYEQSLN